jgi:hypothetical protein
MGELSINGVIGKDASNNCIQDINLDTYYCGRGYCKNS